MKRRNIFVLIVVGLIAGSVNFAQPPTSPQSQASVAKLPKGKWFNEERGYREAKEHQAKSGMNMLVYFYNHDEDDEKGLCHWWERYGLQEGKVDKLLENYIKVKVRVPLKEKEKATFSAYRFNKTPAVFVVKPTGSPTKIQVFNWEDNRPELRDNAELADMIENAAMPKDGQK